MGFVLAGTAALAFVVLNLTGDPTTVLLPPDAPPEYVDRVRREMGLDQPLWMQFLLFVSNLIRGDFGYSFAHSEPALQIVLERLPATYELLAASLLLAVLVSLPLGLVAGVHRDSAWERLAQGIELVGQAVPGFWLGIVLVLLLSVHLSLLPVSGRGTPAHLVLPSVTLAVFVVPALLRTMRASVEEVLGRDFVRTARAKGLPERVVVSRHVLKNALVPVISVGAFQVGILIGGAVVIETVFSWPGVGRAMVQAIYQRDFPVVQAGVLVFAFQMVALNAVADICHAVIDPRVRAA